MNDSRIWLKTDKWGEAKRCAYDLDDLRASSPPDLIVDRDISREIGSDHNPPCLDLLWQLICDLELVSFNVQPPDELRELSLEEIRQLEYEEIVGYVTEIVRGDLLREGLRAIFVENNMIQRLVRAAYTHRHLNENGWPNAFATIYENRVPTGIPVHSRSQRLEGRTTGGRQPCRSTSCAGWFIGVLWETGQQTHICSEGWHFDPNLGEIFVVGGGEISARYISPRPFGVSPKPKNEWISREELESRPGWRHVR